MSHRELDTFIIGFAIGSIACLWLGYRLRVRVERWQAGRAARASKRARRDAKHIPFPSSGYGTIPPEQDVRTVLKKPRRIPLERRPVSPSAEVIPIIKGTPHPADPGFAISPGWTNGHDHKWPAEIPIAEIPIAPGGTSEHARAAEEELRAEVIAALVGSGYKRFDAGAAVDACTMVERAGGLESWVAAAFRRAVVKS